MVASKPRHGLCEKCGSLTAGENTACFRKDTRVESKPERDRESENRSDMECQAVEAEIETRIGRERLRKSDRASNRETEESQGRRARESKGQRGMLAISQGKRMTDRQGA